MKSIFKFPAQKKKMLGYLKNQITRFEKTQKGSRHNHLHPDIIPLVESFLTKNRSTNKYLFISRKLVKEQDQNVFKIFQDFANDNKSDYNFPASSL
jgi:hypothetical protein